MMGGQQRTESLAGQDERPPAQSRLKSRQESRRAESALSSRRDGEPNDLQLTEA